MCGVGLRHPHQTEMESGTPKTEARTNAQKESETNASKQANQTRYLERPQGCPIRLPSPPRGPRPLRDQQPPHPQVQEGVRFSKEALQILLPVTPYRGRSAASRRCCRVSFWLCCADLRTTAVCGSVIPFAVSWLRQAAEQAIHQEEERGRVGYRNILRAGR